MHGLHIPAPELLLALSIFSATFIYEDGATLLAASLSMSGRLDPRLGFVSTFLGIWIGDLGLYALGSTFGRVFVNSRTMSRFVRPASLAKAEAWFASSGGSALVASRFLPGSRLPLYIAAGTLKHPLRSFAMLTGGLGLIWVGLIFTALRTLPLGSNPQRNPWFWAVTMTVLALPWLLRNRLLAIKHSLESTTRRWRCWEFWPAWLFYAPVALMAVWLGVKHRGFSLPTISNPGFYKGGIIGESKIEILRELIRVAPESTAESYLLPAAEEAGLVDRARMLGEILTQRGIHYPFVLKPDVAQRGEGFKVARTHADAVDHLARVSADLVIQEYVPGPKEVGIFYYRFPHEDKGQIFAITDKAFPVVEGNGKSTLKELVLADARAALIADVYLERFAQEHDRVIPAGETIGLVEAGNHCQGCIFRDGMHLATKALEERIDAISSGLEGFFIGRFDLRYADDEALARGEGFQIIELNGASSEATSIYDARNSLLAAYRTLYRQWELVYAIGAANRELGHAPVSAWEIFMDWRSYQKRSKSYPIAD